jgi:hypothetical protein
MIDPRGVALIGLSAPLDTRTVGMLGLWVGSTAPYIPQSGGGRNRRRERLLREDEELLVILAGAIASGVIH